jgi:hypothetical protein
MTRRTFMRTPIVTLVALSFLFASGVAGGTARAAPTFTTPLTITNPYHPFTPAAVKVFSGRKDGKASVIVDLYLEATRTFQVGAASVDTHVLQETEFAGGRLVEISHNFFAQADDGNVYYFGELVDTYTNGTVSGHEGSWLVGGPTDPGDPAITANAPVPTVFMVASPKVGDTFKPEDLFPTVDETVTVKGVALKVGTPAGKFSNSIRVEETTQLEDPPETKWYTRGVGVIKGRTKGESFGLVASTLAAQ